MWVLPDGHLPLQDVDRLIGVFYAITDSLNLHQCCIDILFACRYGVYHTGDWLQPVLHLAN